MLKTKIKNPIIPGFHPDPSICRVDDDFYLVTSSFSFYPGVPIFHSRDLANWEQIGYVLDRPEQLPLPGSYSMLSGGIFAPTIRYHEGTFYMITTNMSMGFRNFIVTAQNPAGPWSDIHVIEDAVGIDPSLFFDDDGKVYYTGTIRVNEEDGNGQAIWGSEIDLDQMKLVGEKKILWKGAMEKSFSPEGPHIYKKDGWYYLMIAEGGTEHFHAVTISRSKEVLGNYEGYEGNPILTHRHLGKEYPICNVGHGDLVQLKDGSWYMVMLGSRLIEGYHKILGRETFIAPVVWEDGWPIVSLGTGKIELEYPIPDSLTESNNGLNVNGLPTETDTDFKEKKLGYEWNEIGNHKEGDYRLSENGLELRLIQNELVPWEIDGESSNVFERFSLMKREKKVGFIGRRQQHIAFHAKTELCFEPEAGEAAGIVVLQNDSNQIRVEYCLNESGKKEVACISTRTVVRENKQYFEEQIYGKMLLADDQNDIWLKVNGRGIHYSVSVGIADENGQIGYRQIAENVDASFMGSETSGGYIGAYIGLFAFAKQDTEKYVQFKHFSYGEENAK